MSYAGDELTEEMDKAFAALNFLYKNYGLLADGEEDQLIEMFEKKLITVIEETFADVDYPGDDHLAASKERWESVKFAEAIRGKHWKELSEDILYYADDLTWLTPEAIRFYLPAFLIPVLKPCGYSDWVYWFLQPLYPPGSKHAERFRYKLSAFSAEEKAVLRAFVRLAIEAGALCREKETLKFWNL